MRHPRDRRERIGEDLEALTELARGFRKRTWVTARLMAKLGTRLARENLGMAELAGHVDPERAAAAARAVLEQLGGLKGLAMKLGQMMSYLDHSLPPEARAVLARLQAQSQPMAYAQIAAQIRDDLGGEPEDLFDRFVPTPFAAASIGQVHRADRGGVALAVKVQYPGIDEALRADIKTVGRLARLATLLSPVQGAELVDELAARVLEECDYRREADNLDTFAGLLAGHPTVEVPALHRDRSGQRVLTTELVERAPFAAFAASAPQASRDRAGAAIYEVCMRSIFGSCAYNADPHPGNYLFGPGGEVTLLDFGCVKYFPPAFIAAWKRLARAILAGDEPAFRDALADAGLVGRRRRFDYAHQLEAMRLLYQPMLAPGPSRFTPEHIARVHDALLFKNRNKLRLALPPDWLFVNRLQFGLFSVLAELGAEADWGTLFRAALDTPTAPVSPGPGSAPARRE
jgi:predicted unusual protein kinase regulating ubiquinone biosynthesis (AarF/ABC1/UbiB family)